MTDKKTKKVLFAIVAMCLLSGAAYKTEKPTISSKECSSDNWCIQQEYDDYTLWVTKDSLNKSAPLNQQPYYADFFNNIDQTPKKRMS